MFRFTLINEMEYTLTVAYVKKNIQRKRNNFYISVSVDKSSYISLKNHRRNISKYPFVFPIF